MPLGYFADAWKLTWLEEFVRLCSVTWLCFLPPRGSFLARRQLLGFPCCFHSAVFRGPPPANSWLGCCVVFCPRFGWPLRLMAPWAPCVFILTLVEKRDTLLLELVMGGVFAAGAITEPGVLPGVLGLGVLCEPSALCCFPCTCFCMLAVLQHAQAGNWLCSRVSRVHALCIPVGRRLGDLRLQVWRHGSLTLSPTGELAWKGRKKLHFSILLAQLKPQTFNSA